MDDDRKELARLRRIVAELAGRVHDIVEERVLTDHGALPALVAALSAACEAYHAFRRDRGL
jgi:hypothetical protein